MAGDCRIRIKVSSRCFEAAAATTTAATGRTTTTTTKDEDHSFVVVSRLLSADTSIRELVEDTFVSVDAAKEEDEPTQQANNSNNQHLSSSTCVSLLTFLATGAITLWDCTTHPPRDITDWPLTNFPSTKGLLCKTLFEAGWYPSGSLQLVAPRGAPPTAASAAEYDDVQYNNTNNSSTTATTPGAATVQLVHQQKAEAAILQPLPSQILASVTERFDDDQDRQSDLNAIQVRIENRAKTRAKERERHFKLDQRIRALQETNNNKNSKQKKVSDQVRRMLMKSRATGPEKELKQQDRFYLHCIIDNNNNSDDDNTNATIKQQSSPSSSDLQEEYRFFSPQYTVARILSSFHVPNGKTAELLVKKQLKTNTTKQQQQSASPTNQEQQEEEKTFEDYRRLPTILRIYEAVSNEYLKEFDTIIVRLYDPEKDVATTDIDYSMEDNDNNQTESPVVDEISITTTTAASAVEGGAQPMNIDDDDDELKKKRTHVSSTTTTTAQSLGPFVDQALGDAIRQFEEESQKGQKTKKKDTKTTAASLKVRQMQMKSKASGDAKRVNKMEQRFFFELVNVVRDGDNDTNRVTSLQPIFMGRTDPIDRIVRDCCESTTKRFNNNHPYSHEFLLALHSDNNETGPTFQRLEESNISFEEAERQKVLNCFDRLIVRFFRS